MSLDDYSGTCELTMTRGRTLEEELLVGRADPRVTIVGDVVRKAQSAPSRLHGPPYMEMDGDLLRINGDNRTVVYRLVEYHKDKDVFLAEWPG